MARLLSIVAALLLVAGACASGSDEPTTVAADDGSDVADAADAAPVAEDSSEADAPQAPADAADAEESSADGDDTPMNAVSPIGAFFAEGGGFEAALDEYTARVEEEIVRCMAEQGFEFKPTRSTRSNPVEDAQAELSERAWTLEFGYGISTSFDSIASNQATDPNAEIIFSLSAGEREAWLDTLFGVDREGFDVDTGARPLEEQGCIGSSIIATGGQGPIEGLEDFGSAYEEGEQAIYDRPEMITAVEAWSQCMGAAGYPGNAELDDPEDDVRQRLDAITTPLGAALDAADDEEMRALVSGDTLDIESLPGLDVDALRELQSDERAIALADLDCYDEHVRAIFEPLRDEFERGLLTDYDAELTALRNIGQ